MSSPTVSTSNTLLVENILDSLRVSFSSVENHLHQLKSLKPTVSSLTEQICSVKTAITQASDLGFKVTSSVSSLSQQDSSVTNAISILDAINDEATYSKVSDFVSSVLADFAYQFEQKFWWRVNCTVPEGASYSHLLGTLLDSAGRRIKKLINEPLPAGIESQPVTRFRVVSSLNVHVLKYSKELIGAFISEFNITKETKYSSIQILHQILQECEMIISSLIKFKHFVEIMTSNLPAVDISTPDFDPFPENELYSKYLILETNYIKSSINMALTLDFFPDFSQSPPIFSGIISDVVFVLENVLTRSWSVMNGNVLTSIISAINSELFSCFKLIQSKISNFFNLIDEDRIAMENGIEFIIVLVNDSWLLSTVPSRLCKFLTTISNDKRFKKFSSKINFEDVDGLFQSCHLSPHAEALTSRVVKAILNLYKNSIFSCLPRNFSLKISSEEYFEDVSPWLVSLFTVIDKIFNPILKISSPELIGKLSESFLNLVLQRIELLIFKSEFSAHGGLLLEKDLSHFNNYLSNLIEQPVMTSFNRINQITLILTLSSCQDLLPFLNSNSGIKWLLTKPEIARLLTLRRDLSFEDVRIFSLKYLGVSV
ncbi:hypothetical protein RCL1_003828 [Eukaryota sp. TZLM3-RCL]